MSFEEILNFVNSQVWGWPMLGLLLLTGLYLPFGLRLLSVVRIPYAFKQLFDWGAIIFCPEYAVQIQLTTYKSKRQFQFIKADFV